MVDETDRYLTVAPIFHIGGMGPPFVMLARGASIALAETFSTDRFWDLVRSTESTVIFLLGVMASFLIKQPPSKGERDHKVRVAFMVPLTDDAAAFKDRFGIGPLRVPQQTLWILDVHDSVVESGQLTTDLAPNLGELVC